MIKFKKIKTFMAVLSATIIFSITSYAFPVQATYAYEAGALYNPVVQMDYMYTYEQMTSDISKLKDLYPNMVTTGSIGTTALGRNIPYFTIGNPSSGHNILIQSTTHAREYIATQVTMKLAEKCLYDHVNGDNTLDNVCFYIVPMVNPDGVAIAQFGADSVSDENTKNFVIQTGHTNEWKANAMGVDINRNFDIGWENLTPKVEGRSFMNYKGDTAVSENETKALVAFASAREYDAFISYHMQGNIIYYDEPGNTSENSLRSTLLAQTISGINGYGLRNLNTAIATDEVQQGGFNDWVQIHFNKPGCTVELGTALAAKAQHSANRIYKQNQGTWEKIAKLYY